MLHFPRYMILVLILASCGKQNSASKKLKLSEEFKSYWYHNEAEITSYSLKQARYGEIRDGEAVLIYVTEDFLPEEQVKANSKDTDNISVLKLNSVKKFITGIYPYSIMQSCFYPLNGEEHALKISTSIQEWCGQVYLQLNNRNKFDITSHSYFQDEADSKFDLEKTNLENEVWTQLRVAADSLPVGDFKMIPSFEYLRLNHKPVKAYPVHGEYYTDGKLNVYMLEYKQLNRKLKIYFSRSFPFTIEKWEESYPSGFGENAEILTTTALKKQRIKTDYWNKNSNKDLSLRSKLDLD